MDAALQSGVNRFFMPNIDVDSIPRMLQLENDFPARCFPMMGLHPCYVKENWEQELAVIEAWLRKREFCAVGEIGIDLYWDKTFLEAQQEVLRRQIRLANELQKPVVIHCRESFNEIIDVLDTCPKVFPHGIFHCFTGSAAQAHALTVRGFYLGIGGVLTFKKSGLAEAIADVPLEQIVLETDGPYLAPAPHRGKRNEPSYLRLVAAKLAEIKGLTPDQVAEVTTRNSQKLFGR
jgi:TatD DNase family protein